MTSDKLTECARYDERARLQIADSAKVSELTLGSQAMPAYLRSPYLAYERNIAKLVHANHRVLEVGAGAGLHTRVLLETGAEVVASDISPNSLHLLTQRSGKVFGNLKTVVADMECLPFDAGTFDVVACAGCLSYGDPHTVDAEIKRVLRPGGLLICVDSLNHNPIYRANRYFHYLRGNRSRSTLQRMPDLNRVEALGQRFGEVSVEYFGAFSFAMPMFVRFTDENAAQVLSDRIDRLIRVKRSAFKFVLVAQAFA